MVNGAARELDVPAEPTGGRTFLPLQSVGETFGLKVVYNPDSP